MYRKRKNVCEGKDQANDVNICKDRAASSHAEPPSSRMPRQDQDGYDLMGHGVRQVHLAAGRPLQYLRIKICVQLSEQLPAAFWPF